MTLVWDKRVGNLIGRYKPEADIASFRNQYRDAVRDGLASTRIRQSGYDLLLQAREYLESWLAADSPDPADVFRQWRQLYENGRETVPITILESLLRRLPNLDAGVQWEEFILRCSHSKLVQVLLDRHFSSPEKLNELAKTKSSAFYQSAAFDVLIDRKQLGDATSLWVQCAKGTKRPLGLLSANEAIVHCYAAIPGTKGDELIVSLLLNSAEISGRILELLFNHRPEAMRLCRYLISTTPARQKSAKDPDDLLTDWVARCLAEISKGRDPGCTTASLILGSIRLYAFSEQDATTGMLSKDSWDAASDAMAGTARSILKEMEAGTSRRTAPILVVRGDELYSMVQDYLRELPSGNSTGEEAPERALKFERYRGIKQVLEHVLHAMQEPRDEGRLRDALEVAMFNCDVRSLGVEGEQTAFDGRLHETEATGVLPGDPVVVTHSGRQLGDTDDAMVLTRAKVAARESAV
jgi:hypothetical protein